MHVTLLIKRIWSWYIRLFCIRSIPCSISPAHDTVLSQNGFLATGKDTQLKVSPTQTLLYTGWYKLTYEVNYTGDDHLFVPKIYPGYLLDEASAQIDGSPFRTFPIGSIIELRAHFPGAATHLFHYDFDPEGFRFDPFELDYPKTQIHYSDEFRLSRFKLTYYGEVSFALLCLVNTLRPIGHTHQKRRIRNTFGLLRKRGAKTLLRWLAHKAYLNLQPPFSPTLWYENFSKRPTTENRGSMASAPSFTLFIFADRAKPEDLNSTVDSALLQNIKIKELIIVTASNTPDETCSQANRLSSQHSTVQWVHCEYQNLEKAFKLSTCNVFGLLRSGDRLLPGAIESLARSMGEADADIAYGDEVIMEGVSRQVQKVVLRPGFCLDHFLNSPFLGMMTAMRSETLNDADSFSQCPSLEAVNEYLVLSALSRAKQIVHVPRVLLEHQKTEAPSGLRRLPPSSILEFLQSHGFSQAAVKSAATPGVYSIRYNQPLLSKTGIVIPTKNNGHFLKTAVDSLERTVPKDLYDLVIVNHESDDPTTVELLQTLATRHRVIDYQGVFNFSSINNSAVRCFSEEISSFLFMNNDIEAIEAGWLENMRDLLGRREVGIVGATLLYPSTASIDSKLDLAETARFAIGSPSATKNSKDGSPFGPLEQSPCLIQHAGVMLNVDRAEHYQKCEPHHDVYRRNIVQNPAVPSLVTRTFSAVTAACMLTRRDVFEALGGFDDALAVGYQDVDLCLRAHNQGFKSICSAEAVLFHHESVSRGAVGLKHEAPGPVHLDFTAIDEKDPHPADSARFSEKYQHMIGKDPFYPPMLSRSTTYYRPVRVPERSDDFDDQVTPHENPNPY